MTMAIPLRIKALCLSMGDCESERSTVMFVHWTGRPFVDAREAVLSFVGELRRVAAQPEGPKRESCCAALLAENPTAKACPKCGVRLAKKPAAPIVDVFAALWDVDGDGWYEARDPHGSNDVDNEDHGTLGRWRFFCGLPKGCDVVSVDYFDGLVRESSPMPVQFEVTHVGARASRPSASGRIAPHEVKT